MKTGPESSDSLNSVIVYLHTEYEELHDGLSILANLGKRRNYCIQNLETDYVFLMDADAKILDSHMFEIVKSELEAARQDICIYKIKFSEGIKELPVFPIRYGTIDTLNYCISTKLAKNVGYPTTVKRNTDEYGNDFWFFNNCLNAANGDYIFLDKVFGQYNGNNTYLSLQALINNYDRTKVLTGLLKSIKVFIYRRLLNPLGL